MFGAIGPLGKLIVSFRGLGGVLLRLVGGPIGLAITVITFLIVKYNEWAEKTIEFAGVQTTGGQAVASAWNVIKDGVGQVIDSIIDGMAEMVGITDENWAHFTASTESTWDRINKIIAASLGIAEFDTKSSINAIAAAFNTLFFGIGELIGRSIDNISTFGDIVEVTLTSIGNDIGEQLTAIVTQGRFGRFLPTNFFDARPRLAELRAGFQPIGGVLQEVFDRATSIDYVGEFLAKTRADLERNRPKKPDEPEPDKPREKGIDLPGSETEDEADKKKRADNAKKAAEELARFRQQLAENELAQHKQILANFETDLKASYEAREITIAEYYSSLQALREQAIDDEIAALENQKAAETDRVDQLRLTGRIEQLKIDRDRIAVDLTRERTKAEQELNESLADRRSQLLEGTAIGDAEQEAADIARLNNAVRDGAIRSQEEIDQALAKIRERYHENFDQMTEFGKEAARNIQDAFADFLFDPFKDGLKGMLRNFIDTIRRIAANALAAKLGNALFGEGFASGKGEIGGLIGGLFGLGKPSVPQPGDANFVGPVQPGTVAQVGTTAGTSDLAGTLSGFFSGIFDGFQSGFGGLVGQIQGLFSGGFGNLFSSFSSGFSSLISGIGDLIGSLVGGLSGGGGGGSGAAGGIASILSSVVSIFAAKGGGVVPERFDSGGIIKGPGSGTSDSIPTSLPVGGFVLKSAAVRGIGKDRLDSIMRIGAGIKSGAKRIDARVSNGEYFIPPDVVSRFGVGFFEQLNRFENGGLVGATRNAVSGMKIEPAVTVNLANYNLSDPRRVIDMIATTPAGTQAVINVIGANPGSINNILGRR